LNKKLNNPIRDLTKNPKLINPKTATGNKIRSDRRPECRSTSKAVIQDRYSGPAYQNGRSSSSLPEAIDGGTGSAGRGDCAGLDAEGA
jgi:hypothetical protein